MGENDVHQVRCPEWDKCPAKGKCPKGFDRVNGCHGTVEKEAEKPKPEHRGCFAGTCKKCGHRYGWIGKLMDKPPCPECGNKPDMEELKKAQEAMDKVLEEANHHTCPRRMNEVGPWEHKENLDHYEDRGEGVYQCSFCGSLSFHEFERLCWQCLEDENVLVQSTDKSYKYYVMVKGKMFKFYMQHWTTSPVLDKSGRIWLEKALKVSRKRWEQICCRKEIPDGGPSIKPTH